MTRFNPRHGPRCLTPRVKAVMLLCQRRKTAQRPRHSARAALFPGVEMARLRVCAEPGCPELSEGRHCHTHQAEREQRRGTRQARGYDATYDAARRMWQRRLDRGEHVECHAPTCLMPMRLLLPGQPFDLGHDDARHIRGPEHPTCNRSAGGKAAHGG